MMKKAFKKIVLLLLICISITLPIFAEDSENEDVDTTVIELPRDTYELEVNTTQTVPFSVNLEDEYSLTVTSSNPDILEVDMVNEELIMTTKSPGTATINILVKLETLVEEHHDATITVTVLPLTGTISFERETFYLIRGLYYDIEYEITPSNINPSQVIWRSSNPEIATVVNGRVTGLKIGHTTITGTLDDHVEVMEVYVTVPLEKIEFNPNQVSIEVDKSLKLPELIYVPYDTTASKAANYKVVDPEIVVLNNGVLEALQVGSTQVIASVGEIETILNVTVRPQALVSDIQPLNLEVFDFSGETLYLRVQNIESYMNRRYDLQLPVESVLTLMEDREMSRLMIVLDDSLLRNQFTYFNQMHLSAEIMEKLDTNHLQIDFVNEDLVPRIRFLMTESHASGYDLNFTLGEIGVNDAIYQHIKQTGAISVQVNNPIQFAYQIGIHQDYTKAQRNQLHFVYEYNNASTHESQEPQETNEDDLVMINMTNPHMLISLKPLGKAQGTWIIYVLAVPVIAILGYVLWKVKNNVFKRS